MTISKDALVGGSVVLSVLAVVLAALSTVVASRRVRMARKDGDWERTRRQRDLVAVADLADQKAAGGVERPGTAALLTLYPAFDFTGGGAVIDPRGTRESRAQEASGDGGAAEG